MLPFGVENNEPSNPERVKSCWFSLSAIRAPIMSSPLFASTIFPFIKVETGLLSFTATGELFIKE